MQSRLSSFLGRAAAPFLFPRTFAIPGARRTASDDLHAALGSHLKKEGRARILHFVSRCLQRLGFTSPTTHHTRFAPTALLEPTLLEPHLLEAAAMASRRCPDPFEGAIFHPARMLRPLTPDEETVVNRLLKFRLVESRLQAIFVVVYLAEAGFDPDSITQAQQIAMWSGSELAPVDLSDPIIWMFAPERPLKPRAFWPLTRRGEPPQDDEAD